MFYDKICRSPIIFLNEIIISCFIYKLRPRPFFILQFYSEGQMYFFTLLQKKTKNKSNNLVSNATHYYQPQLGFFF